LLHITKWKGQKLLYRPAKNQAVITPTCNLIL
jgi:hypothetical protein